MMYQPIDIHERTEVEAEIRELKAEIENLKQLLIRYKTQNAAMREAIYIQNFEQLP